MRGVLRRVRVPTFFLMLLGWSLLFSVLFGGFDADTLSRSLQAAGFLSILFAAVPAPGPHDPTSPHALGVTLTILVVAVSSWALLVDLVFAPGTSLGDSATSALLSGLVAAVFGTFSWWVARRRVLRGGAQPWPITAD